MELKFNQFTITGTAEEMYEFMRIVNQEQTQPVPEAKAKPKTVARKDVDWAKAKALRDAGWTYDKIGEELRVSGVTVRTHLMAIEQEAEQDA